MVKLTPPMGWNSWNTFGENINEKLIFETADAMVEAGCEELYEKQLEARKQVEEIIFHRQHPTVAEYGEKGLLMQSAKVSAATLRGYTRDMTNYIIKPLGEMYMEEVTADDIRLAPVSYTHLFQVLTSLRAGRQFFSSPFAHYSFTSGLVWPVFR